MGRLHKLRLAMKVLLCIWAGINICLYAGLIRLKEAVT